MMQAFLMIFQDLNEANVRRQQTSNFRNYFPQNVPFCRTILFEQFSKKRLW